MTISTSPKAFEDCYTLLQQALDSPNGIRQGFPSSGLARHQVSRLNRARNNQREQNREIYPPDHPSHGTSPYDTLVIRTPRKVDGKWYIHIEPRTVSGVIEELGAAE